MKLRVNGGAKLCGEHKVQGAKNSILPILSACVLCKGEVLLHNCPALSDVESALKILNHLGFETKRDGSDIYIKCSSVSCCAVPEKLMREMRSSIVFLGAILSSAGCAEISMPGGCELGPRPIDIHIAALKKLGAEINDNHGVLSCRVFGRMKGTQIDLWFPSVGATENIILAAAMAEGTTVITNAACEPEIADLAAFLNSCGAKISGAGSSRIVIEGVDELCGCEHSIMPDRIATVTFLTAAAITKGDVTLVGTNKEDITASLSLLEQAGCNIKYYDDCISLGMKARPKPISVIKTLPHPGFPTDAQAPVMALMTLSSGTTMFVETIFQNRFRHAYELYKMGADIKTEGKVAVVNGVERLKHSAVSATDLRGGAALLVAALSAEGESVIDCVEHIDRGYQHIEDDLRLLGADVVREK